MMVSFLMLPDNQFTKLVAIAKIQVKSQRRHALQNIGKLIQAMRKMAGGAAAPAAK
jgi:hypothetical protein